MKVTVQKWGHSLAIRVPSSYARDVGITDGTVADINVVDDSLVVKPVKKQYKLEDMVRQINRNNIHTELDG